ncbi:arylformamidase [Thermaurantimonas aggregans]|uniref:Arylformamidase n=1 Tax=Thermaurantimonas aggregans TaxID=2173829 RepID=A0A401XJR8_9FLAO|nr:cyclase family protein [Thermaurantimonas aggregans]MCX8148933.1 cyclase family protein [Thermaurantimonas aggregans]GCD77252.1 arylformamidase [Thermaurantimonas aggregans]
MNITVELDGRRLDLANMLEISLPIDFSMSKERAWYIGPPRREPVRLGDWVGSTREGGSVNFYNLTINPHAHGTHIETAGHIDHTYTVSPSVGLLFFKAFLYTASAGESGALSFSELWPSIPSDVQAIVIRTLPNTHDKAHKSYSNTHPPYIMAADAERLARKGIFILLIDLPSVDPERDNGALAAHRSFWEHQLPHSPKPALIGEFLYIPHTVPDGPYALHIQHPAMNTDAVPARIFLIPYL